MKESLIFWLTQKLKNNKDKSWKTDGQRSIGRQKHKIQI